MLSRLTLLEKGLDRGLSYSGQSHQKGCPYCARLDSDWNKSVRDIHTPVFTAALFRIAKT